MRHSGSKQITWLKELLIAGLRACKPAESFRLEWLRRLLPAGAWYGEGPQWEAPRSLCHSCRFRSSKRQIGRHPHPHPYLIHPPHVLQRHNGSSIHFCFSFPYRPSLLQDGLPCSSLWLSTPVLLTLAQDLRSPECILCARSRDVPCVYYLLYYAGQVPFNR